MSFNGVLEWKALLAACKIHGDVSLAANAAKRVLGLDPGNCAAFKLLQNIYSEKMETSSVEIAKIVLSTVKDLKTSKDPDFKNFRTLESSLPFYWYVCILNSFFLDEVISFFAAGPETPELLSASFGNEPLLCSGIWITLYSILVLLLEKVYLKFQFTSRKVQHIDTRIDYCTNASRNKSSSCYLTVLLHLLNDRVIHSVVTHGSQYFLLYLLITTWKTTFATRRERCYREALKGRACRVLCFRIKAQNRKTNSTSAEPSKNISKRALGLCHPCERAGLFWLVDLKAKLKSGASQQECGHILGQSIWRKQQRGYIQSSLVFIQMGAKLKGGGVGDGGDRKKRKRGVAWEGFGKLWSFLSIPEFTPPHSPQLRGAKKQQARLEPAPYAFLYEDAPVTDMPSPSPRCVRVSGWLRCSIVLLLAPDVPYSMTPRQRRKRHVTQSLDGLALDPCHSNSKTGAAAAQRHSNDLSREPSWTTADYGRAVFLQRQAICGVSVYSSASNLHPERHGCKAELNTRWTGPCASRARHQSSYRNPEAAFNGQTYTANQLEDTATHSPLLLLLPLLLLHFAFPGITRATRLHQTKQRKSPTLDPSGGADGHRKRFSHLLLPNLNIFANVQSNKGKEWRLGIKKEETLPGEMIFGRADQRESLWKNS
ncbi:hypothetical protein SELMODRAFT_407261 [Selaginella moellendorffii]|uniref:Uncharacterized protein n=1 Tax=Selaginella moellendorffii TaxID=88036 RepID=D8R4G3_SELML|nr:hypothetical protein SELMODRAFT_407261 [Selaginella moellendorffii]